MRRARAIGGRLAGVAVATAACVALAACAAPKSQPATGLRVLFRSGPAHYAASDAPARWYAATEPVAFSQTGLAAWHADPAARRGLGGWLARMLRRKPAAGGTLTAIAPTASGLPTPSFAYVTNLQTFATIRVRVDQRAAMGKAVISLPEPAARQLGGEPGRPLLVRVRYGGPVVAYREGGSVLRTAFRRPAKRDVELATAAAPAPPPAPVIEAPRAVAVAPAAPPVLRPAMAPPVPGQLRVQAGAFASRANAERAVGLLARAGEARIEPVQVGATMLYRVWLRAPADRVEAEALRARVAQAGFADARLVRAG